MLRRLIALLGATTLGLLATAPAVLGADPAADPRCAEWEQHGAPAGIDLRLLCAANEVVGTYTGDQAEHAELPPLAGVALAAGIGLAVLTVLATRLVGRRAGRRLAPAAPAAWWVCPTCRSVNAAGKVACYACRTPAPADAVARSALMPTAATFETDQRFGRSDG